MCDVFIGLKLRYPEFYRKGAETQRLREEFFI